MNDNNDLTPVAETDQDSLKSSNNYVLKNKLPVKPI